VALPIPEDGPVIKAIFTRCTVQTIPVASVGSVTHWPEHLNVYQFFLGDRLVEGLGERPALRLGVGIVSYAEVDQLTAGFGTALDAAGVDRSDRVLLVMPDGPDFVAALFATLRRGAVVVMLNPGLTADAMGAIADQSQAVAAVVDPQYRDHFDSSLKSWRPTVVDPGVVKPGAHDGEHAETSPDDPAIWLFSGGTTGAPKAVVQTHKSLANTTRLYGQGALGLTADDITMSIPKLYFGYATGSNLLFPFSVGASSVLFAQHPTPEVLFDQIREHRPTVLVNVPSGINQMLSAPGADSQDLSSLRLATSAGEALPETLYNRWKDTFGVELLDGLGTAEMWHIFVTNTAGDVRPGTLGKVVPGFEIKACDDNGVEVIPGEVGRLWVKGDSMALGYYDDPERTEEAFRGEWFVGGDLVSIDEDGYVTHRGRADDAIKVKGKWFRPQEVESTLLDHPAVKGCAVVAVEDEAGLARPVAFVVASDEVSENDLIDWSLQRMEAYKHPRRVYFLDELPQTHLGKVDRSALKRAVD
jgi:benzoate-CoA ligase family protein